MSRRPALDIGAAAVGGLIAAAGAVLICVLLAGLAKPEHLRERLAKLDQIAARTEKLSAKPGDPSAYPPRSVCERASPQASDETKARIASLANASGVTLSSIIADAAPSGQPLTPIKVNFAISGHYDAALTLLQSLSKAAPLFFVDRIDLKSDTSSVDLKVAGNIYCWTSDHP